MCNGDPFRAAHNLSADGQPRFVHVTTTFDAFT
jgi:hypothetical protein